MNQKKQLLEEVSEQTKNQIIENIENNLKNTLDQDGHWTPDDKRIRVVGIK